MISGAVELSALSILFEMRLIVESLKIDRKILFALRSLRHWMRRKWLFCRSFSHENSDNCSLLTTNNVCLIRFVLMCYIVTLSRKSGQRQNENLHEHENRREIHLRNLLLTRLIDVHAKFQIGKEFRIAYLFKTVLCLSIGFNSFELTKSFAFTYLLSTHARPQKYSRV